jgi:lipopolysaccharide cholinephosphotransferase
MNDDLRKFQLIELQLLKKIIKIIEDNNLTYYALGGTLLGAIRHKGFIPWDDDIDIGLPREDYEKLIKICNESDNGLTIINYKDDVSYFRYFAHIEDSTMKIERHDKMTTEIANAWIDIFPLDGMPSNNIKRKLHKLNILYQRAMYRFSVFDKAVDINKKNRPLHEAILIKIGLIVKPQKILNTKKRLDKLDKVLTKCKYDKCNYLVNAMGVYKFKEMFPKSVYGKGEYYQFEDIQIFGPENYDFVLKQMYGDYMTPPKLSDRNHHESTVVK